MQNVFVSITVLHDSLIEVAETERRLPAGRRQKLASWPDFKHDWLAYADEKTAVGLGKANARQIDRYDQVLDAIIKLREPDDRRLLWATAHSAAFRRRGPAWSKLAKLMHTNRRTVKQRYEEALHRMFWANSKYHS